MWGGLMSVWIALGSIGILGLLACAIAALCIFA